MGLLSEIYSYGDGLKRKLNDFVANPGDSLDQFAGQLADQRRKTDYLSQVAGWDFLKTPGKKEVVVTALAPQPGPSVGFPEYVESVTPEQRKQAQGLLAQQAVEQYMPQVGAIKNISVGQMAFDPRFDMRAKEQPRLRSLVTTIDDRPTQAAPAVDLSKYEGYPFITSMSDRTAAGGELVGVNGVSLKHPVNLRGGQDYMFDGNSGQVWASANGPVKQILGLAQDVKRVTGKDPLYMPWRMAPSGGDFANMTGETMLSYAGANMKPKMQKSLDKDIKAFIPDWAGVSDPASIAQFRAAPDKTRKAIKKMMDVNYRDAGGLSIGEARLSVADPKQLISPDGGLLNVGVIDSGSPMVKVSGHPAYPRGVPGQGVGRLEGDVGIFQLLPEVAKARGLLDPRNPRQTDLRALQMKPYAGILSEDVLKSLGY